MKDWPRYQTIKYYYSDKSTSDKFYFGESTTKNNIYGELIATLILTEDGCLYLNLNKGSIITPDSCRDNRVYPFDWQTIKSIKYAIDYQPYDFEEWNRGHAMYSKDFWHKTYKDIREFKIKLALGDFQPSEKWIG